jgi:hypothetical protein
VFDILDLTVEFLQLSLFRPDQLLFSTGVFLLPIDLAIQLMYELVAILPLRSEQPPIEDMSILAVVRDRQMNLAQIDSSHPATQGSGFWFFKLIGGKSFILDTRPVNADDRQLRTRHVVPFCCY